MELPTLPELKLIFEHNIGLILEMQHKIKGQLLKYKFSDL